ncbi:MAG: TIGR00730 family Rossman fold protein [Desulfuromonadia bacterium]
MELSFRESCDEIEEAIQRLLSLAGTIYHPRIVREMIIAVLKSGQEIAYPADLKMLNTTLKEMRYTHKVFAPYRNRRKVTIFGSARTEPDEAIYQKCVRFARGLAQRGFMVITGGGGGIMQAGNEGAGSDNSFAANIRLPFEQSPNPFMYDNPRLITYKYFFNRKVAFVKETDAVAVFPGGFGTLDEAMEVCTLIQTGKTTPKPLVLVDDEPSYWEPLFSFIKEKLLGRGLISAEDFAIFTITPDEEEAIRTIETFYRNYHSIRFVGEKMVIRLRKELTDDQIRRLASEFPELLLPGTTIERTGPLPEEQDEPELLPCPRIVLSFDHKHYGFLTAFINRLNLF